jgi:hypothetical protein
MATARTLSAPNVALSAMSGDARCVACHTRGAVRSPFTGVDPSRGPDRVLPMLLVLAHEQCPVNGEIMWAGLGRFDRIFLGETRGVVDRGAERGGDHRALG